MKLCPECDAWLFYRCTAGQFFVVCLRCDYMIEIPEVEWVKLTGRY